MEHPSLTAAQLHVPGYQQAGDPGAVGAGKMWVDTSGGSGFWLLKIRNTTDTGWELLSPTARNVSDGKHYRLVAETNPQSVTEVFPENTPVD